MKKNLVKALGICLVLFFTSCTDFFMKYENYVETLSFKTEKYYVEKDDYSICYLNCYPEDSFSFYEAEFKVSDETICKIIDYSDNYCFIQGIKQGTCILTAEMNNKTAKCIVTVVEEETKK